MPTAEETIQKNVERALSDDGPPGIRVDMETCVLAKDTTNGFVLIGGLGPFGVGRMWFRTSEWHRSRPGWDSAPEVLRETK